MWVRSKKVSVFPIDVWTLSRFVLYLMHGKHPWFWNPCPVKSGTAWSSWLAVISSSALKWLKISYQLLKGFAGSSMLSCNVCLIMGDGAKKEQFLIVPQGLRFSSFVVLLIPHCLSINKPYISRGKRALEIKLRSFRRYKHVCTVVKFSANEKENWMVPTRTTETFPSHVFKEMKFTKG